MTSRSKNSYQAYISDFIKDILIVCPVCSYKAIVKTSDNHPEKRAKVVCAKCGFNKLLAEKPSAVLYTSNKNAIKGNYMIVGAPVDPFFSYPLWLMENVGEELLWAYNYEHLEFLRQHVEAKLRERNDQEPFYRNQSLGSRLPKWMTSKNNRDAVLKAIERLRKK